MLEALAVFQLARGWSKAEAAANICEQHHRMVPKRAGEAHHVATRPKRARHEPPQQASAAVTSHRGRAERTDAAKRSTNCSRRSLVSSARMRAIGAERTLDMLETLAVFQLARFWSKAEAALNICEQTTACAKAWRPSTRRRKLGQGARGMSHPSKQAQPRQPIEAAAERSDAAKCNTKCSSAREAA
jgi:hypothetical protein